MNEKGLVANLLYLTESEYVTPSDKDPAQDSLHLALGPVRAGQLRHRGGRCGRRPVEGRVLCGTTLTPDGKPGQLPSPSPMRAAIPPSSST